MPPPTRTDDPFPLPSNGHVPWWIKFIYTFGIPAALSVYLIWLLAARIEGKIDDINEQFAQHQSDSKYNVQSNEHQMMRLEEIYRVLQRICVNSATSREDRNACFAREASQ